MIIFLAVNFYIPLIIVGLLMLISLLLILGPDLILKPIMTKSVLIILGSHKAAPFTKLFLLSSLTKNKFT